MPTTVKGEAFYEVNGKKMRYMKDGKRSSRRRDDDDPLSGVANLFDVAMVFALGLMVMLLMYLNISEVLTETEMTIIKNPGQQDMEVIVKSGEEIKTFNMTEEMAEVEIVKTIGTIGLTPEGKMVYVPETG
ncbi:MAG: DUF2149 domain-containing protein [Candidatus Methanospirareceae archaeon]